MPYLDLLRRRDFGLLWLGATVSILGDGLTWVALVWLVYELGGSPADVSLLVVAYTAPVVVGGLGAGVVLDRFDRRRVVMLDNAIRGVAVGSVPIASVLGVLVPAQPYAVAAVYGLLHMVSLAGFPAMVPSLVPEDRLPAANALETVSYGVGGVAGPALGGVLMGAFGGAAVLAIDAATYAAFVACLSLVRLPGVAGAGAGRPAVRHGLGRALRFIVRTPAVLATTLMFMSFNVGEGMLLVLLPVYARDLAVGATGYGFLVSAFTAGLLGGSVVVGAIRWRWTLGRSIAAFQLAAGIAILALMPQPPLVPAALVLALVGALASPLTIWAQTVRMRLIPDELRGRVFSLLRTLMQSTPPIGGIVAAGLLSGHDVAPAVVVAALLFGVPGLVGLMHPALAHAQTVAPVDGHAAAEGSVS